MTVEELFEAINCEDKVHNPFEVPAAEIPVCFFEEKYICKRPEEITDEQNEMWESFVDAIMATRKQGFMVGYKTALSLLFKNNL